MSVGQVNLHPIRGEGELRLAAVSELDRALLVQSIVEPHHPLGDRQGGCHGRPVRVVSEDKPRGHDADGPYSARVIARPESEPNSAGGRPGSGYDRTHRGDDYWSACGTSLTTIRVTGTGSLSIRMAL